MIDTQLFMPYSLAAFHCFDLKIRDLRRNESCEEFGLKQTAEGKRNALTEEFRGEAGQAGRVEDLPCLAARSSGRELAGHIQISDDGHNHGLDNHGHSGRDRNQTQRPRTGRHTLAAAARSTPAAGRNKQVPAGHSTRAPAAYRPLMVREHNIPAAAHNTPAVEAHKRLAVRKERQSRLQI